MISIFFNGTLMDLNNFNGSQGVSFVFRKKTESGDSGFSFSPELTLTSAAFDLVFNQIINTPNPVLCSINVEVYDDCCNGLLFTGIIKGADVSWCEIPNCECTVTIVDNSTDAEAIRCLKNIFPWDKKLPFGQTSGLLTRGIDEFRFAPFMYYCNDLKPSATQEAIMILGIFLFIIITPILLLFQLGNIIAGLDRNEFSILSNLIVGCGRRHVAPFVDSQFKNMCKICGLAYSSSLFDVGGYYHNTARIDMPFVPGEGYAGQSTNDTIVFNTNKPNLNGIQFLDDFKQFNIDWKVSNGVLQIERKDYFTGSLWFDATLLDQNDILSLCFDATDIVPAAYAEYEYPKDGVDNSGDEVARGWSPNVIDWNTPDNGIFAGLYSRNFTYGAAQFRFDSNSPDINPIDKQGFVSFYPFVQNNENEFAMFIEKGVSSFPKLINIKEIRNQVIVGNPDLFDRGYAVPDYFESFNGTRGYNYKWWITKSPVNDIFGNSYDTAYQKLFFIDDPRLTTVKNRGYTLVIDADCTFVSSIDLDGFIRLSQGGTIYEGDISEVTYNMQQNTLTITGKI